MDPLPADVIAALQRGNKIEAIKRLRQASGLGLKEAKDAVEAAEAAGLPHAGADAGANAETSFTGRASLAPGEVPRRRGSLARLLLAALVAAAVLVAWFQFR